MFGQELIHGGVQVPDDFCGAKAFSIFHTSPRFTGFQLEGIEVALIWPAKRVAEEIGHQRNMGRTIEVVSAHGWTLVKVLDVNIHESVFTVRVLKGFL